VNVALRRLGFYLVSAWASITLNFAIPRLMPGDPAAALVARFKGQMSPEALRALRHAFGLVPGSTLRQYFTYLAHVARGDLGLSIAYFPAPVTEVIGTGLGWSLGLGGFALVVSFTLGTLLGVVAAWRRGGRLDSWLPPALSFLGAFPYFWLAMLVLYLFGFALHWFPLQHARDPDLVTSSASFAALYDVVSHAILPATAVVLATLGGWMLSMRGAMLAVLGTDAIKLATAKGLPPRRIMWAYAARNALLPSVTSFGMALGFVVGGSLLTEIVFSYPGLGYLLVQAVRNQDTPLMQGLFLIITLSVLAANFLVDMLYIWLDPRARA
jgi:peptide/nickel transport system permease protein